MSSPSAEPEEARNRSGEPGAEPRVPASTYRLQVQGLGLARARELVDYLDSLGVSDLYTSPLLGAMPGSTHGYDVTDPTRIDPELGGAEALDALATELRGRGLGLLLDIVPNHMASSPENPWWLDVLEHGPASPYAGYFDIDWSNGADEPAQLLRPVLGERYGTVLESGQLKLGIDERGLHIAYFDRRMPLDPRTYANVLDMAADAAPGARSGVLRSLGIAFGALPDRGATGSDADRRRDEAARLRRELRKLLEGHAHARQALDAAIAAINGRPGDPSSFDRLDSLLQAQPYRLAFWGLATRELNYRRFFDIADLVGVRVELPEVFEATHALLFRLAREGKVVGFRIDHVDGLRDPTGYLQRLRERTREETGSDAFFTVVEKILARGEALPAEWPVEGTTGYEFAIRLTGLFVDERGLRGVDRAYLRATGVRDSFAEVVYRKKKQVIAQLFIGETQALAARLKELARHDRHGRDLSIAQLDQALVEVTACLAVYRTYIRSIEVSPRDRERIEAAVAEAGRRSGGGVALDFLRRVLLLEATPGVKPAELRARLDFILEWQQTTGPVMAKGLEDSALYVYNRLLSMNEVGGEPGSGWTDTEAMHRWLAERAARMPDTLNATSTHDTKRSEDVRARISVLSEMDTEWRRRASRWRRRNARHRERMQGRAVPDANEEYLLYQTLLGAWPLADDEVHEFRERLEGYLQKAVREARIHSSWLRPDEEYEKAFARFAERILDDPWFVGEMTALQQRVAFHGAINALAQLAIKLVAPGVPDFYQGTELWDFSLVDPDNRRPVDFRLRRALLATLDHEPVDADELRECWKDGRVKLLLTSRGLRFRRADPDLFRYGRYVPLAAAGRRRGGVFAFAREHEGRWAMAVAPIRSVGIAREGSLPDGEPWRGTTLLLPPDAPTTWRNVVTGEEVVAREGRIRVEEAFGRLPAAILAAPPPPDHVSVLHRAPDRVSRDPIQP